MFALTHGNSSAQTRTPGLQPLNRTAAAAEDIRRLPGGGVSLGGRFVPRTPELGTEELTTERLADPLTAPVTRPLWTGLTVSGFDAPDGIRVRAC